MASKRHKVLLTFLILTFIGPLWLACSGRIKLTTDYRTANRQSAEIAPDPKITPEAVIQAYSAYAFNWRGMFATHTWMAVKPKHAATYTVYQVVGWRLYSGLPALSVEEDLPDRNWYDQKPDIILDLRGDKAETLIPKIAQAIGNYPYPRRYSAWPGPNSNTFTASIARQVPELGLLLPSNAVGKDYLALFKFFARAPSGTGYQFSLFSLLGITLALKEGLEINFLGLIYGISPTAIKLPGFGDIKIGWTKQSNIPI